MTLSRLVILSGMISALAISAPAQEAPQSVVTGVNATNSTFVQVWNKHDPAAIAGTFTPNALFVAPLGSFVGHQGIQQFFDKLFATMHPASNFTHDIDRVEMLSNELAIVTGHWNLADPPAKGFWSAVYEHQGTAWPMRAHTYTVAPPAPATQTTSKPCIRAGPLRRAQHRRQADERLREGVKPDGGDAPPKRGGSGLA